MDDADVDKALARLWPGDAWPRLVSGVREFVAASRAKGYKPTTTAAMLKDAMAAELAAQGLSSRDEEVILSTFHRAVDRILSEEKTWPTPLLT
jgi:hypothetical protein